MTTQTAATTNPTSRRDRLRERIYRQLYGYVQRWGWFPAPTCTGELTDAVLAVWDQELTAAEQVNDQLRKDLDTEAERADNAEAEATRLGQRCSALDSELMTQARRLYKAKTRAHATQDRVLREVSDERQRQDAIWGEQNHPDGTGGRPDIEVRDIAKGTCQRQAALGKVTWRLILEEEVREAFAESDPASLRAELVQVAAVATQWAEAIDRRTCARQETGEAS